MPDFSGPMQPAGTWNHQGQQPSTWGEVGQEVGSSFLDSFRGENAKKIPGNFLNAMSFGILGTDSLYANGKEEKGRNEVVSNDVRPTTARKSRAATFVPPIPQKTNKLYHTWTPDEQRALSQGWIPEAVAPHMVRVTDGPVNQGWYVNWDDANADTGFAPVPGEQRWQDESNAALLHNEDNAIVPRDPGNINRKRAAGKQKKANKGKGGAPLAAPAKSQTSFRSVPLNVMGSVSGGNYVNQLGMVRHNSLGLEGVRLRGRQQYCKLLANTSDTTILQTSTPAATSGNTASLAPIHVGSTLKTKAVTYQRYCFRHITLRYVNINGLTFPGAFTWGLQFDPDSSQAPNAFESVAEMQKSSIFAKATPSQTLSIDYTGDYVWFNSAELANDLAETRQNEQLQFAMWPNANGVAPLSQGYIEMEYVIDLFEPVHPQYTLPLIISPFEQTLVIAALRSLRASAGKKLIRSEEELPREGFELVNLPAKKSTK